MDSYEKFLEDKIEEAKKELSKDYGRQDGKHTTHCLEKACLQGKIKAYQDALDKYKQLKVKER